ncbi:MAG: UDP-N-acetylmuramoyl-L-alanine--D-glutamate ligase [Ruminococcaceae bacterium]|nr:UDP-N-acetylmuramoyl-L-alanine--D-glutamate ligase [Oscillospiraceae bacterium]
MELTSEWKCRLRKPCAVIGLARSNLPLIDFLLEQGVPAVTARDRCGSEEMQGVAASLRAKGVDCRLGENYLEDLTEDVIFRTPAIRPDLPALRDAEARGALITSEMELFLELTPAGTIGVTGSDGKTTTTTLVGMLLEAECQRRGHGRIFVGGNIGAPLLPRLREMTAEDCAVVELSSFQLMRMRCSVDRAALTNLSPNHLDWHRDMAEYGAAKTNLFRHSQCKMLVTNGENQEALALSRAATAPITLFSSVRSPEVLPPHEGNTVFLRNGVICLQRGDEVEEILAAREILLPGRHNLENYMTAIGVTDGLVSVESVRAVARRFRGVAHRLELIRELDGVRYYNSSIDSSPTRTAAALSALSETNGGIVAICGGYDKKLSYAPLAEALNRHASAVVLTGASADAIGAALTASGSRLRVERADRFRDAVEAAKRLAKSGDRVVLSPACASFDAFRNFEERGNTFRAIVESFS